MTLIFFLIAVDSLPPLPILSDVLFPEPELWLEKIDNILTISGAAGDFYDGYYNLRFGNLNSSGYYKKGSDWFPSKQAGMKSSYSIPLTHLWVEPCFSGFFLDKVDYYEAVCPGLSFASTNPWSIISGRTEFDFWEINGMHHIEGKTKLNIFFDRLWFLPYFEINNFYINRGLKTDAAAKVHIRNLHLAIGSSISDAFPAPRLYLQYSIPGLKFSAGVKSGDVYKTLKERFTPNTPLKYRMAVPEENLRVGFELNISFEFLNQSLDITGTYNDWFNRLIIGKNFEIDYLEEVKEINIGIKLNDNLTFSRLKIVNGLRLDYNRADLEIPFMPEYLFCDSLSIEYGILNLCTEIKYLSRRNGLTQSLSPTMLVTPTIALQFRHFTLFTTIANATDYTDLLFDEYRLKGRQYAGGLKFHCKF